MATHGFSTVTLTAPAGTAFSSAACSYVITDQTTGDTQSCLPVSVSPSGNSVTLVSGIDVAKRDVVTVTANGVTNPPTTGANSLAFSTTSDPVPVALPYTLTTALSSAGHSGTLL